MRARCAPRRCTGAAVACLAVHLAAVAAQQPPAVNWARSAFGASATANSAGYWAGYTAEARYAMDDNPATYWSSTGGAVCCTEDAPGWLLVDLGAVRPVAALLLQLTDGQDLTYSLALGNSSAGPWAVVGRRMCDTCTQNVPPPMKETLLTATYALPRAVLASHVRLLVTWSSHGGMGGCADLCDWATNVFELQAWSPGALPRAPAPLPPPPPPPLASGSPACEAQAEDLLPQPGLERADGSFLLSGDAALQLLGTGATGGGSVQLTAAVPGRAGAIDFPRVVNVYRDCPCTQSMGLTLRVWLGGAAGWPGEALAISLVDARRQTPGATRYMPGCGSRAALPLFATSVVLDTADSAGAACDEPGTGVRLVSTMLGAAAAPVVQSQTLDMSTREIRASRWVTLTIWLTGSQANPTDVHMAFVDGNSRLVGNAQAGLRAGSSPYAPGDFYLVVSGRTGELAADAHAVSGVSAKCVEHPHHPKGEEAQFWIPNFDGFRQPLAPPPLQPLPRTPASQVHAVRVSVSGAQATAAFAALSGAALVTLLCCAAAACRRRRAAGAQPDSKPLLTLTSVGARAASEPDLAALVDSAPSCSAAAGDDVDAAQPPALWDVCLSYQPEDWRLADTVQDKLRRCRLLVCKAPPRDVEEALPCDAELLRALRRARVFAPVITRSTLRRVAAAARADAVDAVLAELIAALCFRDAAAADAAAHAPLAIRPLLVGPEVTAGAGEERGREGHAEVSWSNLLEDTECAALLAALPDAAPARATMASLSEAMECACGAPLPPAYAALSPRQVFLGRAAGGDLPPVAGLLDAHAFTLACPEGDFGLHIRHRYAVGIAAALRDAAAAAPAARQQLAS